VFIRPSGASVRLAICAALRYDKYHSTFLHFGGGHILPLGMKPIKCCPDTLFFSTLLSVDKVEGTWLDFVQLFQFLSCLRRL
jgi:hypothetical protein